MSSIESRADENSNRLNIGTSRDSTEGTVDHLNEAPRNGVLNFELAPMVKVLDALVDALKAGGLFARGSITFWHDGDECGTVYLVDDEAPLLTTTPRDGQPG